MSSHFLGSPYSFFNSVIGLLSCFEPPPFINRKKAERIPWHLHSLFQLHFMALAFRSCQSLFWFPDYSKLDKIPSFKVTRKERIKRSNMNELTNPPILWDCFPKLWLLLLLTTRNEELAVQISDSFLLEVSSPGGSPRARGLSQVTN